MDKLKEQIIKDYSAWVEEALRSITDNVGLRTITVENFKLKLDKLIEYANKTEPGKNPPIGDGHSRA
jgi:hypothetical protein